MIMSTTTRNHNGGAPRALFYCIAALLCMSAIAMPAMAAGLADTAWPKFQNDTRNTGQSVYTGPQTNNLVWSFTTGAAIGYCGASTGADGTIYIGSQDKNLYALNPDGTLKWSYTAGNPIFGIPAIGTDGTIYFGSSDKNLYALNPDGTLKWSYTTGSYVYSSPAIGADGTIYIGSADKKLYAINPDGTFKWSYTTGEKLYYGSPAIGADGTIYFGSDDSKLYALNPDGTFKWSYTTGNGIYGSPAIGEDGTIYVGSRDKNLYAIHPDGTLKWSYTTGNTISSTPAIGNDGTIYIGSRDKNLYAITPSGTLKWNYPTGSSIYYGSPVIGADGTVYIGCSGGSFFAVNPDGTLKWSYTTGANIYGPSAIGADGTLYIGSWDYKLYAFRDPVVAPVAAFSADPASGPVPLTVTFTDASTNAPTSWAWTIEGTKGTDFEYIDGTSASSQNPHVQFLKAGNYDVTLVASNAGGSDDEIKTDFIAVSSPVPEFPVAALPAFIVGIIGMVYLAWYRHAGRE